MLVLIYFLKNIYLKTTSFYFKKIYIKYVILKLIMIYIMSQELTMHATHTLTGTNLGQYDKYGT